VVVSVMSPHEGIHVGDMWPSLVYGCLEIMTALYGFAATTTHKEDIAYKFYMSIWSLILVSLGIQLLWLILALTVYNYDDTTKEIFAFITIGIGMGTTVCCCGCFAFCARKYWLKLGTKQKKKFTNKKNK